MTTSVWITNEVNDKIDKIKTANGLFKEGFLDVLLKLSLSDPKMVDQAVWIAKTYKVPGAEKIEQNSKP
jgi:hypothetical protein